MAREAEFNSSSDYGAFVEKFLLHPSSSAPDLPLNALTFAVKDIFDVEGYVTGFGNPEWGRTHPVATSTASAVLALLNAGATCVGKTVMDEMALSTNGKNQFYGTPRNPCAPDRVTGGSSSGSAVVVGAKLADFSLGTDTGGSVRVPAAYCGIFGFRPSHGTISTSGVIPLSQSFDTVGWFSRDPIILNKVGRVLLQLREASPVRPSQIIIAEDCFQFSSIPYDRLAGVFVRAVEKSYGGNLLKNVILEEYVKDTVPSLKHFMNNQNADDQKSSLPTLEALAIPSRLVQIYEMKNNHGEWIRKYKPNLRPNIKENTAEMVLSTPEEGIDICHCIRNELQNALASLLGDFGFLLIPTVPGPPPKLETDASLLESSRVKALSLLAIAGVSGFCQVSIPLGMYDDLPVSISLLAKHGSDGFLLSLVESLYDTLKEEVMALRRA